MSKKTDQHTNEINAFDMSLITLNCKRKVIVNCLAQVPGENLMSEKGPRRRSWNTQSAGPYLAGNVAAVMLELETAGLQLFRFLFLRLVDISCFVL